MAKRAQPHDDLLGAHVSTQGGVATAPERGAAIGATAIQVFTKTPNQWREPTLDQATVAEFREEVGRHGIKATVSHDSYLINLASPDRAMHARSVDSFTRELARSEALGLLGVVSHPGNFMDDREAGLHRNAEGYTACLRAVPGAVMVFIETTAGTGTALGSTFEELARLRDLIPEPHRSRIAFCADTCHIYSAGYDLAGDYDGVWARWDQAIGLRHLRCLHLNDSKTPFNSHRDRHELIAEGSLGAAPFRRIMRDPRFAGIPKLLETPKGDDMVTLDRKMMRRLRGYARANGRVR
jgi:deoxyribonuclease-4